MQGVAGAAGGRGEQSIQGIQGVLGAAGAQGNSGVKADSGGQGNSGTAGEVGPIGPTRSSHDGIGYLTASYTSAFAASLLSQLTNGPTLVFTDKMPLAITLNFQMIFVTKYTIGPGLLTKAPQDCTIMTFFDS